MKWRLIFFARCSVLAVAVFLLALPGSESWLWPTAAAKSATAAETEAFNAAKELGTVEAWEAFLSNYPKGFYADLARAYVKKLAEKPSAPGAPSSQAAPVLNIGPGAGEWQNVTMPFAANSSQPAYAAVVDAGGVQMTAYCHSGKKGPLIAPGLRLTGALPGALESLTQGLASAPAVTGDLSSVSMSFSDGTVVSGAAATKTPQNSEVSLYVDRRLLDPRDNVLELLMSSDTVTVSAPPFTASFQLDGSRAALCSVLEKCGADLPACVGERKSKASERSCRRGQYRNSKGRCVDEEPGQDAKIDCGKGRTWVGAQGRCVCVDSDASWNGKRCVKQKACTGGRTIDPQTGKCDCNGDSVWNGRACVKENEPPPQGNSGQNNNNAQAKQLVCSTLQIACSLGNKKSCAQFNSNCP